MGGTEGREDYGRDDYHDAVDGLRWELSVEMSREKRGRMEAKYGVCRARKDGRRLGGWEQR